MAEENVSSSLSAVYAAGFLFGFAVLLLEVEITVGNPIRLVRISV